MGRSTGIGWIVMGLAGYFLVLAAATIYGFGKTFFWPSMLGVVAEQFPKGGDLTLNANGGVGMLAGGVIGTSLLVNIQDKKVDQQLEASRPELHLQVVAGEKISVFGTYKPLDPKKVEALPEEDEKEIAGIQAAAKKDALMTVAMFPCIMLVCQLGLIAYFRSQGGYKPQIIISEKDEEQLMTGGAEGPAEM